MGPLQLVGKNIVVLDLETKASADDCRHCGRDKSLHTVSHPLYCPPGSQGATAYERIGWENKLALGLSIGCYYSYADEHYHWFDEPTLANTVRFFVDTAPLIVTFNGKTFDLALMRAILRFSAEHGALHTLCDTFKVQCASSYDVLQAIWAVAGRNTTRGLNSLDALAQANGLGPKLSNGAQAPRDWRNGEIATVLNYCQDDVIKTKSLFELVCMGIPLQRSDGSSVLLPIPEIPN
jgi:hypothetical protein